MGWLVSAQLISLLAGLMLLFAGEKLRQYDTILNQPIAYLDDLLGSIVIPVGIVLVIIGGWIVSVAVNYPALWYLHLLGGLVIVFGLLYLFLPDWLDRLSKNANQLFFSTDEFVNSANKSIGVILLISAVFMFIAAYFLYFR
ncbi:MAG: hypothetical protein PHG97_02205 [Candidatus Margulisbacteria bacterium]|nr:hypothetical protein [Candidatus Margulisiibacteriota bacterium]